MKNVYLDLVSVTNRACMKTSRLKLYTQSKVNISTYHYERLEDIYTSANSLRRAYAYATDGSIGWNSIRSNIRVFNAGHTDSRNILGHKNKTKLHVRPHLQCQITGIIGCKICNRDDAVEERGFNFKN